MKLLRSSLLKSQRLGLGYHTTRTPVDKNGDQFFVIIKF